MCSCIIDVYNCNVFLDRPTPPRNVAVSKIRAKSCQLTWDAPLDNGCSEITNYIVEKKYLNVEDVEKAEWELVNNAVIEKKYGVSKCKNLQNYLKISLMNLCIYEIKILFYIL